jgi:hypothetical protein
MWHRLSEVALLWLTTWHCGGAHLSVTCARVGPTWLRWTNRRLSRGTDMLRWPNKVLTRGTLSLFSDSVCVCLRSPVCTQMSLCSQVAPRWTLEWIWVLDLSFNLFYLLWIYFNSSTHPKIIKFSPKIPKFMMIILVIFNSTFSPASLY